MGQHAERESSLGKSVLMVEKALAIRMCCFPRPNATFVYDRDYARDRMQSTRLPDKI